MPVNHSPGKLSRAGKATICRKLHENLVERAQMGPAEPALDAFIPQLEIIADQLDTHVAGKSAANAARVAHLDRSERADADVDTWTRHINLFLDVQGRHRHSPHAASARLLQSAAFPTGLDIVDDRIPDENAKVRSALTTLRAPEHAQTLAAIRLPLEWLDLLEAALKESEAAYADRASARGDGGEHVLRGRNAEADWVDVVGRLRKYVESRSPAGDLDRAAESRALIAPLTDALAHAKALAASRTTRRTKKPAPPAPETTA
ncbi:hypothetical protein [Polyangium aurulentum]|uniref:hypothetical protein n=1 Tax=Polyangium aurulentum TaxID=2567896 RepID=UPI0010AEA92D|nr:hypothetical protein [Polyangium aurulentum]UQA56971.1 hypothetical protein E8A73_037620 [Polyangium aurulentum]